MMDSGTSDRFTLFQGETDEPLLVEFPRHRIAVMSMRCPGKETPNEDSAGAVSLTEDSLLLTVADGVGGHRAGDQASRSVVEQLVSSAEDVNSDDGLRERVLSGIDRANEAILGLGVGAATTATCVTVRDGMLRSYHVGDSMALVVGQRGKLKHQTMSHSPVGYLMESGALEEDQAMEHHERHLVSNLVGMSSMSIDLGGRVELASRDTILLASDGLTDNLYLDEITETIRKGDLLKSARELAERARARMADSESGLPCKPDDLTFVLCRRVTG